MNTLVTTPSARWNCLLNHIALDRFKDGKAVVKWLCLMACLVLVPAAAVGAPAILFTDVEAGPLTGGPNNLGVPISLFGTGFGAQRGSATVTIGGVEAAAYPVWGSHNANNKTLDMIVIQPGPATKGGAVVVTVNGEKSNGNFSFAVNHGKIRYIARNGSDGASCSATAPCATILKVVPNSSPGDTVLIRGGDYPESEIWLRREEHAGGSLGQQKIIKNYPGEEVFLSNAARPFILSADYLTISGIKFKNGKSIGISEMLAEPYKGDKLINNTGGGAIEYDFMDSHGNDHTFAGNVCEVSKSSQGTQGHCFYISAGNNIKLLYNIGSGAPGYGIHIFDQRREANEPRRVISNVLVEGNILKSSPERSGLIVTMGDEDHKGNYIDNVVIRNNIFTANNHAGIIVGGNLRNIKIYNNTFYQDGRNEISLEDSDANSTIEIRNNLFYHSKNSVCKNNCEWFEDSHVIVGKNGGKGLGMSNNGYFPSEPMVFPAGSSHNMGASASTAPVTGSVKFVNPDAFDFRVQAGSSVIGRGVALGASVPTDYNGVPRPQGSAMDIGAFEFVK